MGKLSDMGMSESWSWMVDRVRLNVFEISYTIVCKVREKKSLNIWIFVDFGNACLFWHESDMRRKEYLSGVGTVMIAMEGAE